MRAAALSPHQMEVDGEDRMGPVPWAQCYPYERLEILRWIQQRLKSRLFESCTDLVVCVSDDCVVTQAIPPLQSSTLSIDGTAPPSKALLLTAMLNRLEQLVTDPVLRVSFCIQEGQQLPMYTCVPLRPNVSTRAAILWAKCASIFMMRSRIVRLERQRAGQRARALWRKLSNHRHMVVAKMSGMWSRQLEKDAFHNVVVDTQRERNKHSLLSDDMFTANHDVFYLNTLLRQKTLIIFWASWEERSVELLRRLFKNDGRSTLGKLADEPEYESLVNILQARSTDSFELSASMSSPVAEKKKHKKKKHGMSPVVALELPDWCIENNLPPSAPVKDVRPPRIIFVSVDTSKDLANRVLDEMFTLRDAPCVTPRRESAASRASSRAPSPVPTPMSKPMLTEPEKENPEQFTCMWAGEEGLACEIPSAFRVCSLPHVAYVHDNVLKASIPMQRSSVPKPHQAPPPPNSWHMIPALQRNRIIQDFVDAHGNEWGAGFSFESHVGHTYLRSTELRAENATGIVESHVRVVGVMMEREYDHWSPTLEVLKSLCNSEVRVRCVPSDRSLLPPTRSEVAWSERARHALINTSSSARDHRDVNCVECGTTVDLSGVYFRCLCCTAFTPLCATCGDDWEHRARHDRTHILCKIHPHAVLVDPFWSPCCVRPLRTLKIGAERVTVPHTSQWHVGVYCDVCKQRITGRRWKCVMERDCDLCDECEGKWIGHVMQHDRKVELRSTLHNAAHVFALVPIPLCDATDGVFECRATLR